MARTAAIIVGGGIAAGAPFTLGALTKISSVTPPAINASIAVERTQGGLEVITVRNNAFPAQTETLQVLGGLISDTTGSTAALPHDNVIIGRNASALAANGAQNVVIGFNAKSPNGAGATTCVVIGAGTDFSAAALNSIGNLCVIGAANSMGANFPTGTTVVGTNNTWNNAFAGPGIGINSNWQGAGVGIGNQQSIAAVNNWVVIGRSSQANANGQTAIGDNVKPVAGHTNCISIGRNTISVAANSLNIGATGGAQISLVLIGAGDTQVGGQAVLYRHTNGSGADDPAGNIDYQAGLSTGNSGVAAGGGRIRFFTGAPGASGAALQAATLQFEILPNAGGAAAPVVSFPNYTSGAAANVGTLNNAPSAGNPTEWIPILAKGNVRYIPAWT